MANTNTDEQTLKLIEEVNRQKKEISKAEKPNWLTNCSFSMGEGQPSTNLHVESDVRKLVSIAGFIITKEREYKEAAERLGATAPEFKWGNHAASEWIEDIKTRMAKVQISEKKRKLEILEERLNKIVSPELRAQLELEAITRELSK